jgi:hypothetical protein
MNFFIFIRGHQALNSNWAFAFSIATKADGFCFVGYGFI